METIGIWRATTTAEMVDGNPVTGPRTLWKTIDSAYCWPTKQGDIVEVGRDARITGYNIVIRSMEPTGVTDADEIEIKGERFFIDGDIGPWITHAGQFKGEEFAVKRGVG